MARKAVRLSDIAEKLGVSTVTVSNALANQRGVSEELREKIKEMASEMGYHAPGTVSYTHLTLPTNREV